MPGNFTKTKHLKGHVQFVVMSGFFSLTQKIKWFGAGDIIGAAQLVCGEIKTSGPEFDHRDDSSPPPRSIYVRVATYKNSDVDL